MDSIEQKNKLSIMKAMMGNPQIAKTMHKAFKAKIGSTDRKKGQDLIAIFSKVDPRKDYTGQGGIYDGKGGPSIPGYNNVPESMQRQRALESSIGAPSVTNPMPNSISSMAGIVPNPSRKMLPAAPSILSKINTALNPWSESKDPVLGRVGEFSIEPKEGYKTPTKFSEESLSTIAPHVANLVTKTAINPTIKTVETIGKAGTWALGGLLNNLVEGVKMVPGAVSSAYDRVVYGKETNPKPDLVYNKPGDKLSGLVNKKPSGKEDMSAPKKEKIVTENIDANGNKNKVTEEVTGGGPVEEKVANVVEGPKIEQVGTIDPTTGKPFVDPNKPTEVTNVESGSGSTNITETGGSQVGSSQVGSSQVGSSQSGSNVTSTPVPGGKPNGADLETLKLAFEGTPIENMPVGKDYQKQLYELQTLVETENNVNGLKKQAEDLQNQAPNVKIEYADYIRGKDEAISQIDKMLSEAYDVYASGGLTPEASERQGQYIKMLEGMKANHNVSYTKFLNRSIDQFNSEVQRVDNLYRNAVNQANVDYERKGSLLKADYETHLDNYVETQKAIEAANKTNNDALEDYYKSLGLTIEGALAPIKSGEFTTAKAKIAKDENLSYGNDKNEINPDITLANFLWTKIEDERNYSQQTLEVTASAIRNRLNSIANSGEPEKALNELSTKWIQQIKDIITEPQIGGTYPVWKSNAKQLAGLVLSEATPIVRDYVSSNFDAIKTAMADLNPINRTLWWDKPAKTRDEFITDNSSKVSPIMLATIYDMYSKITQNNNGVPIPIADLMSVTEAKGLESNFDPKTSLGGKISTAYINRIRSEVNAQ